MISNGKNKSISTAVTTRFLNYINKKMDALKDVFVAAQIVSLLIFAAVRSDWKKTLPAFFGSQTYHR